MHANFGYRIRTDGERPKIASKNQFESYLLAISLDLSRKLKEIADSRRSVDDSMRPDNIIIEAVSEYIGRLMHSQNVERNDIGAKK